MYQITYSLKNWMWTFYVKAIYFVYLIHYINIVACDIINLFSLFFTLICFQSFITDNLLVNLLYSGWWNVPRSNGKPNQTLDCIDSIPWKHWTVLISPLDFLSTTRREKYYMTTYLFTNGLICEWLLILLYTDNWRFHMFV